MTATGSSILSDSADVTIAVYPVIVTNEGLEQDGSGCESWLPQDYVLGTELSHSAIPESEWTGDVVSESRICKGNTAYCTQALHFARPILPVFVC